MPEAPPHSALAISVNDAPDLVTENAPPSQEQEIPELVAEFIATLTAKTDGTQQVYRRTLRQLASWIAQRPGSNGTFRPENLTATALSVYMAELDAHRWQL